MTSKQKYRKTAEETIEYVLRDLRSDSGGFYSSQDADVGRIEGGYYIWSEEEIDRVLGDKAERFKKLYNVKSEGNYLEESTGERTGRNVLYLDEEIDGKAEKEIEDMRKILFEERRKREIPGKDKKILTDWNSLMIVSLLKASKIFENDIYLDEAEKGLDFILNNMASGEKLYHRYIEGEVGIEGMLDDYSFFIWSLIYMYRLTEDEQIRERAIELSKVMVDKFWDDKEGGFYFSSTDELPLKEKEVYDGAYPSGNSIALLDMIHLYSLTSDNSYKEMIEMMLDYFSGPISTYPGQYTMFLNAYELYIGD